MRIIDIIQSERPGLSFEVSPPSTLIRYDAIKAITEEVAALKPDFMSVTYGAGGGTSKYTLDIAKNIKELYDVPTLAHLTCVSSSKEMVHQKIAEIKAAGISNVMALRGDIPAGLEDADRSHWDYQHAIELIRELKEADAGFCIGGACYPEIHPESLNQKEDIKRLKEKVDAGCDFLTTQMFFDNNIYYSFMYKALRKGIDVPVVPGIMPVTNASQVKRIISLSGNLVPTKFTNIVDRFGDNPEAMKQAGIAYATEQIIDLIANGVNHIHIYSMNKPDVAGAIMNNLSHIYVRE